MTNYTQQLWSIMVFVLLVGLAACSDSPATPAQPAAADNTETGTQAEAAAVPEQQTEPTATAAVSTEETVDEPDVTTESDSEEDDELVSPAETQSEAATTGDLPQQQYGLVVSQLNDRGFNDLAWAGMERAAEELGVAVQFAQDTNPATGQSRINQFINQGYDGIIAVGPEYSSAIKAAAQTNPDIPFAIVDFPNQTANDRGLLFDVDAPAFIAGYLAAGMSQSGTVCTYGGRKIPSVLIFMVGFEYGVEYYNAQNETSVEVLGWTTDPSAPNGGEGVFAGNFTNRTFGETIAEEFAAQGCDIIFPVAGAVGLGTAEVAADNDLTLIGVDADQSLSNPEYADLYLTSVIKHVDRAVFETVSQMAAGDFVGGNNYIGILADGDVGLAPFHSFEDRVPQALKDDLAAVEQGLGDGSITTGWPIGASQIETSLTRGPLGLVALRNATYSDTYTENETAPLVNGRYEETDISDSLPGVLVTLGDQIAYGDLDADGQEEAVVIVVSNPGGSGVFYDLAVMADQDGTPTQVGSAFLGDRIQLKELDVEEGLIKVVMVTQGPDDAQCCPTQRVVIFFGLQNDELVELASQVVN